MITLPKIKRYKVMKMEETEDGFRPVRTDNMYLVVNIDEPYAEQIFELIKEHEKKKGTWDGPELFKDYIALLLLAN